MFGTLGQIKNSRGIVRKRSHFDYDKRIISRLGKCFGKCFDLTDADKIENLNS